MLPCSVARLVLTPGTVHNLENHLKLISHSENSNLGARVFLVILKIELKSLLLLVVLSGVISKCLEWILCSCKFVKLMHSVI